MSSPQQWTLPPELWLMVVRVVSDSDPDPQQAQGTLKSISLTCRDFRRFALPLLCETFAQTPPRNSMPLSNFAERQVQRLDSYASDRIAPYVCHLKVRPWITDSKSFQLLSAFSMPATVHEDPLFFVSKFFDMLPRFTDARSLKCDDTVIGLRVFKNLSALPCLRSINFTNCVASNSHSPNDSLRPSRLHTAG